MAQQVATAMDTNHDGMLSFDESLNADIAGPTLRPLLAPVTDALRRDLALGVANEQLPAVQISPLTGNVLAFLNRCRRLPHDLRTPRQNLEALA